MITKFKPNKIPWGFCLFFLFLVFGFCCFFWLKKIVWDKHSTKGDNHPRGKWVCGGGKKKTRPRPATTHNTPQKKKHKTTREENITPPPFFKPPFPPPPNPPRGEKEKGIVKTFGKKKRKEGEKKMGTGKSHPGGVGFFLSPNG